MSSAVYMQGQASLRPSASCKGSVSQKFRQSSIEPRLVTNFLGSSRVGWKGGLPSEGPRRSFKSQGRRGSCLQPSRFGGCQSSDVCALEVHSGSIGGWRKKDQVYGRWQNVKSESREQSCCRLRFQKVLSQKVRQRRFRCSALQGGDPQQKPGATGKEKSKGAEGLKSEDAGEEDAEPPEKEESVTEKMLRELREKAEEQARKDREASALYKYGQREYGRGEYAKAVQALQSAVDLVAKGSALGGEMQIWLAMAFDANGQRADGLAMYRKLEASHPLKPIKLQAANLRYIMEAPRLKISKEERVTIPLVGEDSQSGNPSFSELYKERRRAVYRKGKKIEPDIWDRIDWKPPRWQKNPYFWVAFTLWLTLIAVSMAFGD